MKITKKITLAVVGLAIMGIASCAAPKTDVVIIKPVKVVKPKPKAPTAYDFNPVERPN